MPPKSRGRGRTRGSGRGRGRPRKIPVSSSEEDESNDEASDNSEAMDDQQDKKTPSRKAPAMEPRFPRPVGPSAGTPIVRRSGRHANKAAIENQDAIPDILQEMVAEVTESSSERPLKKRRIRGQGRSTAENSEKAASAVPRDRDSSVQFEDVTSPKAKQTFFRESDDESDDNDLTWEDVDVEQDEHPADRSPPPGPSTSSATLQDLELNLSINTKVPQHITSVARRKPITKEERQLRINIHKMHILCLLAHVEIRNSWCNDSQVHDLLRPRITSSMMKCFKPEKGSQADQMSRIDSIKAGLRFAQNFWTQNFKITARGVRRALWANGEEDLENFKLPDDIDSVHDIEDFRTAAKDMKGSRDVGAQLYCAFLRCAGLDVRLVCSLQPLSCKRSTDEPSMPAAPASNRKGAGLESDEESPIDAENLQSSTSGSTPVARRRFGNSGMANHNNPAKSSPAFNQASQAKDNPIKESPYPIYWVEVLADGSTTRWIPVNPSSLNSVDRRLDFEPPASDRQNNMNYVVAFEDDGKARDVTRRYTKAFNSKTRKLRVESTERGDQWWKNTMNRFSRGFLTGFDDLEHLELARYEAQEPMPKNIMDFKDHPVYALERHLKRNEVLVSENEIGTIAAGVKVESSAGGSAKKKKLEKVYRRRDVKVVKSSNGWYRIGREVKMGEQPVKIVPPRSRADDDMEVDDGEVQERAGIGLYTEDQTEIYEPPPVVNGRVPTNTYGNLDIYVPSMVPKGGVHIPDPEAKLAARIVGVHSADAVTGFEFRGRHGTAIIRGIVVATEFQEAIQAVIQGIRDEQQNAEDERRSLMALKMWKKFIIGLRVIERVAGYEVEGERDESVQLDDPEAEDSGMETEEYIDDGAGGFFPE